MNDESDLRTVTDGHAIGVAMRSARRRLGLSQRALADALGWDRAKVGRWEAGEVPEGFVQVVGLLRVLGLTLEVSAMDPTRALGDEPAEHLADRGHRRFPAHLELCDEHPMSTWNWTRHRGEPSPGAAHTSFRRRTQADVTTEEARQTARTAPRALPRTGKVPPDPPIAS